MQSFVCVCVWVCVWNVGGLVGGGWWQLVSRFSLPPVWNAAFFSCGMRWGFRLNIFFCIWFYFYAALFSLFFSKRDLISHAQYLKIYFAFFMMVWMVFGFVFCKLRMSMTKNIFLSIFGFN